MFKKYMMLRPADALCLKPLQRFCSDCWHQTKAVGHNTLNKTVKRMVEKVGAIGFYSNHSLWRTCATRLYQQGADEQQIMSVTGHRSKCGVRIYKEICEDQEEKLSSMIHTSIDTLDVV